LTVAVGLVGAVAYRFLPCLAFASGGLSHHQRFGEAPGRKPRDHGLFRRNAAGASIRTHRRVTEMNLVKLHRRDFHCFAIRLKSEYRRSGTGRPGCDQRRPGPTAKQSAKQSLPTESQSRGRANPDACLDFRPSRKSSNVRYCVFHPAAETFGSKKCRSSGCRGGALPAVRVDANPTILKSLWTSAWKDLRAVLSSANANRPKGYLADRSHTWSLSATDQLLTADGYRPLVVT